MTHPPVPTGRLIGQGGAKSLGGFGGYRLQACNDGLRQWARVAVPVGLEGRSLPLESLDDHLVVAYQQRRFDSAEKQGELVSQAGARRFSETSLQILLCSSEN